MAADAEGNVGETGRAATSGSSTTKANLGNRDGQLLAQIARIENNPLFKQLDRERTRLGCTLSVVMAGVYFGFILCVAFLPRALGTPLSAGTVVTWGILVGLGIIAFGFLLTVAYVYLANSRFDRLSEKLLEDLK